MKRAYKKLTDQESKEYLKWLNGRVSTHVTWYEYSTGKKWEWGS